MEFNEKLQELRKNKGLTQEELAQRLYVSRTAVSKWESGRGYPNIESLKAIAHFFSVSLDDLLSTDEALVIASEEKKSTENRLRDTVMGLADICALLFLFLPLFAVRSGETVSEVSLLWLFGVEPYLKASYFVAVAFTSLFGVVELAFQGLQLGAIDRIKIKLSLALGVILVILFTVSLQPYAAILALFLLILKGGMIIKRI